MASSIAQASSFALFVLAVLFLIAGFSGDEKGKLERDKAINGLLSFIVLALIAWGFAYLAGVS